MRQAHLGEQPDDRCRGCDHKREHHHLDEGDGEREWSECLVAICDCIEFEEPDEDLIA